MKPLEGITVVELAAYVAAPASARILAELGANVIKIEGPKGDANRGLGAINNAPYTDDCNPIFDTTNFNKKFVCIETKKPEGKEILFKLLETADVFITNYRTQVLVKMGLDYDSIKDKYPKLVWAQCLGFGEKGPEKDTAGFDFTAYGARGGLAGSVGQEGVPINNINAYGDTQTSMVIAAGVLAALVGRTFTGKGDKVTASLHNTAVYNLHWGVIGAYYGSHYPKSRKSVMSPTINVYKTKDGSWLQLCGAAYDIYMPRIAKAMGIEEEIMGNDNYNNFARVCESGSSPAIIAMLDEIFPTKTCDEWLQIFRAADVPLEKCYTFDDVLEDEQAYASGILEKVTYANGQEGVIVNNPIRLGSMEGQSEKTYSKAVGADTNAVLANYGYSAEKLAELQAAGVIKQC